MRAMILAAGLGTRLAPLSSYCAKPAMPVRGIPVIAHTLTWLAKHDVSEVVVNLHHLPDSVRDAVERHRPAGVSVRYSHEPELLGTGGGMRAVADFLAGSDPSVVVAGDMLVDFDLSAAVARHVARGDRYTLLLREGDPRAEAFGTLGVDAEDRLRRIGKRFDLGGETRRGLFMGIRIVAARCLAGWPDTEVFEDLADWLGPQLRAGAEDVRVDWIAARGSLWEPVGTAEEYLAVNLDPPPLSYRSEIPGTPQAEVIEGVNGPVVVGQAARVDPEARLERVVVWPGEQIPARTHLRDGIWAHGQFTPAGGQEQDAR
jgi:NDP-sugar pyrophosphorylase family protein